MHTRTLVAVKMPAYPSKTPMHDALLTLPTDGERSVKEQKVSEILNKNLEKSRG